MVSDIVAQKRNNKKCDGVFEVVLSVVPEESEVINLYIKADF